MTLLLMTGSPVSAQETEYPNPYGVRLESEEDIQIDPLRTNPMVSEDDNYNGPRRVPALATVDAKKYVISYLSLDGKKESIRLSAAIYIRPSQYYDKLLLNCHPTVTSNFEAPTGGKPVDEAISRICDDNFLVVCPDYCGYGLTTYKQHPYLIHDVTARNCVDAAMAALDFIQHNLGIEPHGNFQTYIAGYSQGGATALACAKYLESDACPQNVKDRLKLLETCCGDGPYSTIATINQYIDWGKSKDQGGEDRDLEYPCVLPLIVAAAKEAYGDGCMRTVNIEDYFSDEFKATGVIEMIKNKDMTTVDLNSEIRSRMVGRLRPVDVFSDKLINKTTRELNTETNEYKCLMRAMEKNDLSKGWVPQHPINFFHLKKDGVVPYANYKAVEEGIKVDNNNVKFVSFTDHYFYPGIGALFLYQGIPCHYFFPWFTIADEDEMNHAVGGTYFYVLYMFHGSFLCDDISDAPSLHS